MNTEKKERIGWYFYDWANSAFTTTVVTVFIGPYLTSITKASADISGYVYPLGIPVYYGSYFAYILSLSVALQVVILPYLGSLADFTRRKKHFLGFFAYLGSLATMAMYFLQGSAYLFGGILFLIANLSFGASIVMYNSYLADIAPPERRDAVSSVGWAFGYIGGGIVLGLNLLLLSKATQLNINIETAVRISLCSAGLWWAVFTIIPMFLLKIHQPVKKLRNSNMFITGFRELFITLKNIRKYPQTLLFLAAYLFFNDGIQAAITMSAVFGERELNLGMSTLTQVILMVQFVAFFGALLFNYFTKYLSSKNLILVSLVIWTACLVYGWGFLSDTTGFFILAGMIAIVLGGSQALSRSVYSVLIPAGKEAEYFSLYEISERGTSWMGPMLFGLALQFTHSYRIAIVSLIIFFIIGFILLIKVNVKKGEAEAAIK